MELESRCCTHLLAISRIICMKEWLFTSEFVSNLLVASHIFFSLSTGLESPWFYISCVKGQSPVTWVVDSNRFRHVKKLQLEDVSSLPSFVCLSHVSGVNSIGSPTLVGSCPLILFFFINSCPLIHVLKIPPLSSLLCD